MKTLWPTPQASHAEIIKKSEPIFSILAELELLTEDMLSDFLNLATVTQNYEVVFHIL